MPGSCLKLGISPLLPPVLNTLDQCSSLLTTSDARCCFKYRRSSFSSQVSVWLYCLRSSHEFALFSQLGDLTQLVSGLDTKHGWQASGGNLSYNFCWNWAMRRTNRRCQCLVDTDTAKSSTPLCCMAQHQWKLSLHAIRSQQNSYRWDETLNTTPQNIWAILLVVCRPLPPNHLIPNEKSFLFVFSRWDVVCLCIHWAAVTTSFKTWTELHQRLVLLVIG